MEIFWDSCRAILRCQSRRRKGSLVLIRNFRTSFLSCNHLNLVIRENSGGIMQLCSAWGRDGGRGHRGARKGGRGRECCWILTNFPFACNKRTDVCPDSVCLVCGCLFCSLYIYTLITSQFFSFHCVIFVFKCIHSEDLYFNLDYVGLADYFIHGQERRINVECDPSVFILSMPRKLADASDWLVSKWQWQASMKPFSLSTQRSVTSSSRAPIAIWLRRVMAVKGHAQHRQAFVLMKCLLCAAWIMTWRRVLLVTLCHHRVNEQGESGRRGVRRPTCSKTLTLADLLISQYELFSSLQLTCDLDMDMNRAVYRFKICFQCECNTNS